MGLALPETCRGSVGVCHRSQFWEVVFWGVGDMTGVVVTGVGGRSTGTSGGTHQLLQTHTAVTCLS
jgi:hypothetical protein